MKASSALFALSLVGIFTLGFTWTDLSSGKMPSTRPIGNLFGVVSQSPNLTPEQIFKKNYSLISEHYYQKLNPKDLKYAGMEGMMASLGDPHTMFLAPKLAEEFAMETRANFVGVGARLAPDPLGAKVVTVFEEGPAFKAGLKSGDVITAVDHQSMVGHPIDEVVSHIRGKENTPVRLELIRAGEAKPIEIVARRQKIITPTVESKLLPNNLGYLSVTSFSEPTTEQFDKALSKLDKQNIQGLVIDLRSNPGGLLQTAVTMLSRFVDNKTVVTMKYRDGHDEVARTYTRQLRNFNYPIAILINEDSASAAEIFSGVLHDYGLATLVGDHSYGKASVQNVFELVDGASAKITIAHYFLPSGANIGRKVDDDGEYISGGLQPDVKVVLDPEKEITIADPKSDPQLIKAMEILKGH